MFKTQTEIIKKIKQLSLNKEVTEFVKNIMDFYKKHISKLQNIISSKSKNYQDNIINKKYIDKIRFLRNYIVETEENNKDKIKKIFVLKIKYQKKIDIIKNLKNEIKEKNEQIKILSNDINLFKKQTNVVFEYNKTLRNTNKFQNSQFTPQIQNYFNETKSVIEEIRNLKRELKNYEENKNDRLRRNRSENIIKKSENKMITFNNENLDNLENRSNLTISKSKNVFLSREKNILKKDLRKSFFEMSQDNPFLMSENDNFNKSKDDYDNNIDKEEIKNYLDYLKENEKKLQQDLWKYPYRGRNKLEKKKIWKIEREIYSLSKEIKNITNIIRNK